MIFRSADIEPKILDPLVQRKILACSENIMMVEVSFKKGGIGEPHAHAEYDQVSYVTKGRFEAVIGDEKIILEKGDGFAADKNVLHGMKALEDSVIIDTFTPIRKDFL